MRWPRRGPTRTLAALSAGLLALAAPALPAAAETLEDCVARRVADGMRQTQALAECSREQRGENDAPTPTTIAETDGGTSTTSLLVAGAIGLAVGLGLGLLVSRRRTTVTAPAATGPAQPAATDHRRLLVDALIDLRDRVPSDALRVEIGERLEQVGVREVTVEAGTPFDPAEHRGIDTRAVGDASWDGRVAETERPGYTDAGSPLRPPEVVVYRHGS